MLGVYVFPALPPIVKAGTGPDNNIWNISDTRRSKSGQTSLYASIRRAIRFAARSLLSTAALLISGSAASGSIASTCAYRRSLVLIPAARQMRSTSACVIGLPIPPSTFSPRSMRAMRSFALAACSAAFARSASLCLILRSARAASPL
jgi:hypothetical protein